MRAHKVTAAQRVEVPRHIANLLTGLIEAARVTGANDLGTLHAEVDRARREWCQSNGCWKYRGLHTCAELFGRTCYEGK